MRAEHGYVLRRLLAAWVVVALVASGLAGTGGGSDTVTDGDPAPAAPGPRPTIHVDIDGGGDYTRIQDAIDNASDGDTILIAPGTYPENVTVNKSVTIVGSGAGSTIVDPDDYVNVFTVTGDNVSISNLTAMNSDYSNIHSGIRLDPSNNTHIFNVNCSNNRYGIYIDESGHCGIENVSGVKCDKGIYSRYSHNITCKNNTMNIRLSRTPDSLLEGNVCNIVINGYSHHGAIINNNGYIEISHASYNTISNNTCPIDEKGIFLKESDHNHITGNNYSGLDGGGIRLYEYCDHNVIENNTIIGGGWISLGKSWHNRISNNIIRDAGGIGLNSGWDFAFGSRYNDVINNTLINNDGGIIINSGTSAGCRYNNISDNTILSSANIGIGIFWSWYNTISNNVVNNNTNGIYLGTSSHWNNITSNICDGNSANGIYFYPGTVYSNGPDECVVANNTCTNGGYGIKFYKHCARNIVTGNRCEFNDAAGLYLLGSCSDNRITDNILSHNNWSGVSINGANSLIENNTCNYNNITGIDTEVESRVFNNTCIGNSKIGIHTTYRGNIVENNLVESSETGIYCWMGDNGRIANNSILYNELGLELWRSQWVTVVNNTFNGGFTGIGLYSNDSSNNTIYHNNFLYNIPQVIGGENESWSSGSEGNHWWDYLGEDNGHGGRPAGDGIGDTALPHLGLDDFPFVNRSGWEEGDGRLRAPKLTGPGGFDADGNYSLSWTDCLDADGYELAEWTGTISGSYNQVYFGPLLSINITGREDGTYHYKVRAVRGTEDGPWSNNVTFVVDHWLEVSFPEDTIDNTSINTYKLFPRADPGYAVFWCEGADKLNVSIVRGTGVVTMTPEVDWCGSENLTFVWNGRFGHHSYNVTVNVTPVNDAPTNATIEYATNRQVFFDGDLVHFEATCEDPDLPYGDELNFTWTFSTMVYYNDSWSLTHADEPLGYGYGMYDVLLPVGLSEIRLNVSDLVGEYNTTVLYMDVFETNESDSDGDGMPNEWERHYGLNPYDPGDADGDMDGDGVPNVQEYLEGTDPTVDESPGGDGGVVDDDDGGDVTVDGDEGPDGDGVSDGDDDAEGTAEKEDSGVGAGNLGTILAVLVVLVVLGLFINEILLTRKWNKEREVHRRDGAPAEHEMAPYDPRPREVQGPADDFEDGSSDIASFMVEGAEERQALPPGGGVGVQGPEAAVTEEPPVEGSVIDPQNPPSR